MDSSLFLRFIQNLLNIRADRISSDSSESVLLSFEKECCFHSTLQPMYTAASLRYLLSNLQSEVFYEITDHLNTNLILFHFQGSDYIIGPYTKSVFSDEEIQALLAAHKLSAGVFLPLKLYYSRFPQLNYSIVSGSILAAMRSFYPSTPEYQYRRLMGFHEALKKEEIRTHSSQAYTQIIQRYEMENFFLRKISEGDVKGVELSFGSVSHSFYSQKNPALWSIYGSNSTGFATIRTLARKAAEQGGCPVVTIDEITQDSIRKASQARNAAELNAIVRELLIDLTCAVAEAKKLKVHSPVVRKALSYLSANYAEPLSLKALAANYHVSAEYLSREFKKEIGQTITAYMTQLRTEKAADLLRNSKLSIAEIAAFVGYPDSNYFVKVFKKRYGMTPSAYR